MIEYLITFFAYCGGLFLGMNSPEEMRGSKKYFEILLYMIFGVIFVYLLYAVIFVFSILHVIAIIGFTIPLVLKRFDIRTTSVASAFALLVSPVDFIGSLTILGGLVSGSLFVVQFAGMKKLQVKKKKIVLLAAKQMIWFIGFTFLIVVFQLLF